MLSHALMGAACLTFAISDLCIVALIDGLQQTAAAGGTSLGRLHVGGLAMAVTYVFCGGLATAMFASEAARPRGAADWRASLIYAVAWLGGMVALYTCFGLVGAVFGNILQSSRGILAIAMGAGLAHVGRHDLEMRVDRETFLRRIAAAALMTAAIALSIIDLA